MLLWIAFGLVMFATVLFLVMMALRTRRIAARLPGVAAGLGLTFEANDPFHAWAVDSPDASTTRAVLGPAFRSWLTAQPEQPYLGARDGWVLLAARGQRPDQWGQFLRDATAAADRFAGAPAATVAELLAAGRPDEAVRLLTAVPVSAAVARDADLSLRAATLEAHGDGLASRDPGAARAAYAQAAQEQRAFASGATAGGEGLARSAAADALDAKATDLADGRPRST